MQLGLITGVQLKQQSIVVLFALFEEKELI